MNEASHTFIAEILIDKSKTNPEFKIKASSAKKEPENNNDPNYQYKTTYLVVRDYSNNGATTGYPLSNCPFIQDPEMS